MPNNVVPRLRRTDTLFMLLIYKQIHPKKLRRRRFRKQRRYLRPGQGDTHFTINAVLKRRRWFRTIYFDKEEKTCLDKRKIYKYEMTNK
jgi:hypothetical protein